MSGHTEYVKGKVGTFSDALLAQNIVLRTNLAKQKDEIAWLAQTIHQAHHDYEHEPATFRECGRGLCNAAVRMIARIDAILAECPPATLTAEAWVIQPFALADHGIELGHSREATHPGVAPRTAEAPDERDHPADPRAATDDPPLAARDGEAPQDRQPHG